MKDTLPKITIITVVYNGASYIESTIENVVNLRYDNLDYIVIDGGSTDETVAIINKYNEQISYWISEPDRGIYDAMNKGWSKATEDSFVLFLGAGDKVISLPDMRQYIDVEIVYGDVFLGEKRMFNSTVSWRSFFGNTIHHQAMLVKKSLHIDSPFSLDYKIYADFDFNQRLLKNNTIFIKDNKFQGFALEGGISEQLDIDEIVKIVKKNHGLFMSKLARIYFILQKFNGFR